MWISESFTKYYISLGNKCTHLAQKWNEWRNLSLESLIYAQIQDGIFEILLLHIHAKISHFYFM